MNAMITKAALIPVIDRVFPFEKVHDAYARLIEGAHFGKVVITL
jgi:NADPH:quinone reductase-like Zn-dependent oxidoreductase